MGDVSATAQAAAAAPRIAAAAPRTDDPAHMHDAAGHLPGAVAKPRSPPREPRQANSTTAHRAHRDAAESFSRIKWRKAPSLPAPSAAPREPDTLQQSFASLELRSGGSELAGAGNLCLGLGDMQGAATAKPESACSKLAQDSLRPAPVQRARVGCPDDGPGDARAGLAQAHNCEGYNSETTDTDGDESEDAE